MWFFFLSITSSFLGMLLPVCLLETLSIATCDGISGPLWSVGACSSLIFTPVIITASIYWGLACAGCCSGIALSPFCCMFTGLLLCTHRQNFCTKYSTHGLFYLHSSARGPCGAWGSEQLGLAKWRSSWKEGELQMWVGLQTYSPEHAVPLIEVNLILSGGLAASKLTETGIFSFVTWS